MAINDDKHIKQTLDFLGLDKTEAVTGIELVMDNNMNGLHIKAKNKNYIIKYSDRAYLFRALGLISEKQDEPEWSIKESAAFRTNGVMLDCSRNAVPTVKTVKKFIMTSALMGLNMMMLYMEDVFTIPDEPYWGYMRGRYTQEELQELDEYAAGFGIELIPCIQTLAHLARPLKWERFIPLRDIDDIILADNPGTYELVEKMIASLRSCFRTGKIHIGMDEAFRLGRGNHQTKYGPQESFDIICRHLDRVADICKNHGFDPMIWSDMFFPNGYHREFAPEERLAKIPKKANLVYWDYRNRDREKFDRTIKKHKELDDNTMFAGGAWKWHGFAPKNWYALIAAKNALNACRDNGIKDVVCTCWGDDGAEASHFSCLPVISFYAEFGFGGNLGKVSLDKRFKTCTGASREDFLLLDLPDIPKGKPEPEKLSNVTKLLLYQDSLLGLFDVEADMEYPVHYREIADKLHKAAGRTGEYSYIFKTLAVLSELMEYKSCAGLMLKDAYDRRDKNRLKEISCNILAPAIDKAAEFHSCIEKQWMIENKAFGYEVLDIRLSGVHARLKSAKKRVDSFIEDEIDRIEELEGERLRYVTPVKSLDYSSYCSWQHTISPCGI